MPNATTAMRSATSHSEKQCTITGHRSLRRYGEDVSWVEGYAVKGVVAWVPLGRVVKIETSPASRLEGELGADYVVLATLDNGEDVWMGRFPTFEDAAHFVRVRLPAWPQTKPV